MSLRTSLQPGWPTAMPLRAGTSGANTSPEIEISKVLLVPAVVVVAESSASVPGIVRVTVRSLLFGSDSMMYPFGFTTPRMRYGPGVRPVMSTHWSVDCAAYRSP